MPIRFALADHVARVTIDRPEVLNAIDVASERELQALWARIEADPEVRVVVLTGTGERAFSAGADLKERSGASQLDYWATKCMAINACDDWHVERLAQCDAAEPR